MLSHSDQATLWKYLKGEIQPSELEQWLYNNPALEPALGAEFYGELLCAAFENKLNVYKERLEKYLRKEMHCECMAMSNLTIVDEYRDEWYNIFETLQDIKKIDTPNELVILTQCTQCHQYWLFAHESLVYEVGFFKRLSVEIAKEVIEKNSWPPFIRSYEELLLLCTQYHCTTSYPAGISYPHVWAIQALQKENPSIPIEKIAYLLGINIDYAAELYRQTE